MIKSLIFDIGGIVLDESGTKAREVLCKKFGINSEKFKRYALRHISKSYSGKLHYLDFFEGLRKQEKLEASSKEMAKEWFKAREKTSKVNNEVKKIILALKKNYLVGSFTNSTLLNDKAKQRKEAYKLFDFNLISYKIGPCKPEPNAYKILILKMKQKKIKPDEMIFIDDEVNNLIVPKKLGMKTILFENAKRLKKELGILS